MASHPNTSRVVAGYCTWWLLWIGTQAVVLHQLGFSWAIALTDASITQAILCLSGYVVYTALRFYQPKQIILNIFSWSIGMALLSVFVQKYGLAYALSQSNDYQIFLGMSLIIRGAFDWLMISFITLTSWLWFYVLDRQENEKQKEHAERLAREAELSDLRSQLQPHFLFNSLNSISALIGSSPDLARTMIQQLSDFLRGTVRKDNRQLVTLEEELRHLQLYLDIEKIRFGHRLATRVTHDEQSLQAKIPSLLLQPIVENAIKFGLYDTIGEILITIDTTASEQSLLVQIVNPFDPTTASPRKGTGFGLKSIRRRLYLMYAQNDLLITNQTGDQFSTTIKIPQTND